MISAWQWVIVAAGALGVAWWLVNLVCVLLVIRRVPALERVDPKSPETWPKLSIIIPARDEARDVEEATRSRLDEGYPNLEVVLVDDRSQDGTGEIMDRIAADDPRVRVIHINEAPDDWLGKVNALQRGLEVATGDWLLFSDADVYHKPDTMRKAVALCEERGYDHLAAIPHFWSSTFMLDCAIATFMRIVCLAARMWSVENPDSSAAVGCGAFNLVRRSAFERTPGFEHLRLTVVDDVALGQMMKQSGASCAAVSACEHVGLYFYRSLPEAMRGVEKSSLVAFRYSYTLLTLGSLTHLWLELSPIAMFAYGCLAAPSNVRTAALIMGVATVSLAVVTSALCASWARVRPLPAVLFPIGVVLGVGAIARGAALAMWRRGHHWRGVIYDTRQLRENDRLRFP